jgi:hypothetical protein
MRGNRSPSSARLSVTVIALVVTSPSQFRFMRKLGGPP